MTTTRLFQQVFELELFYILEARVQLGSCIPVCFCDVWMG